MGLCYEAEHWLSRDMERRESGGRLWQPYYLALLTEAYGKGGQTEEGLVVVTEALTVINNSRERAHEAELYRLKGELLLQQAHSSAINCATTNEQAAETCFRQAINIARRQSAKSLELRAVMSLSRLLQKQGKGEEARQMLAEIYGWFMEGFDTIDLKRLGRCSRS